MSYPPVLHDLATKGGMMVKSSFWWRLTHLEPTVYRTAIVAFFGMLASFGILVSPEIPNATISFVLAITALVQAMWVRQGVTANDRVAVLVPDPVDAPDVVVPGPAVTNAPAADIIHAAESTPRG